MNGGGNILVNNGLVKKLEFFLPGTLKFEVNQKKKDQSLDQHSRRKKHFVETGKFCGII